jgi:glycosyltransferase involved in cell wall biosynthesis
LKILLAALGAMHTRPVARALQDREALAGLWISDKNNTDVAPDKYRRCWPYHLAMKPFYHLASIGFREQMALRFLPIWTAWIKRQIPPEFDVAYACMGQGAELFEIAERTGALKLVDASSSHPTSFYGFWQRECDLWNPGAKVALPQWLFQRCNQDLERADLIICPSKFVRDSMLYNGIPESKCALNPYGVDTSIFKPRNVVPEKPRFVCVATICLRKGHQYLFRAFEKVRVILPEAELICVGSYYPDFARERKRWEDTFTHLEHLAHSELAKVLQGATAFVLPSTEEGFARAIIEGMAAALPIIATHESGATTLVDDGVEGLIIRTRDVNHLAEAMIKIATDQELNRKMGEAAHERGARNNTWGDFADRLIRICEEAIDRRKPLGKPPD